MWVVCKFKDDGSLFVNSRKSRENMISVLQDLGQEIESVVLREFDTYEDANKYKQDIENTNKIINKL